MEIQHESACALAPKLTEQQQQKRLFANEWARTIEKGDVVRAPSGLLRVVRDVHRCGNRRRAGTVYSRGVFVRFVIRRCSWTHRPVTSYSVGELVQIGYVPTTANHKWEPADAVFDSEMARADLAGNRPVFTCCDVEELP